MTNLKSKHAGFTLIEISVVIGMTLILASVALLGTTWWGGYRERLNAEATLNTIAAAQRSYLLDNPTLTYSNITTTVLAPYCPGGTMPTISGATISVTVFPPTATKGGTTWTARDY